MITKTFTTSKLNSSLCAAILMFNYGAGSTINQLTVLVSVPLVLVIVKEVPALTV
jgi:hypothetical protein